MKGFIACALAYAPIYSKSNLDRDIHFSFTFDEETACIGAPILIKELEMENKQDLESINFLISKSSLLIRLALSFLRVIYILQGV